MSKRVGKVTSLMLILFMLVAVAAGCGSNTADTADSSDINDTSGETTGDDAVQPSEGTDEELAAEEPTYDFGGRSIRHAAWWNAEPQEGKSESQDKLIARIKDLEEKYNFKMEYVNTPWEQYVETYTASTLAGEPFADIVETDYRWFYPGFVANGFLYPLSDLEAFDFQNAKWSKPTLDAATFNGKIYGIATGMFYPRGMLWWNKSIFEREGLPNLYELVANDDWTWDKMLEIAKKATKDLDGDGVVDQWGFGGLGVPDAMVVSNGGTLLRMDGDKPVFALNEPAAIEALQFYQDLINVHKVYVVAPDGAEWNYSQQAFQDGKIAMHPNEIWMGNDFNENMQDDYGLTVFPKGPRADGYTSIAKTTTLVTMPIAVDKPEEVALFWDKRTDPFPDDDPEAWKESYESFAKDNETIDIIGKVGTGEIPSIFWTIGNFKELEELSWDYMWQISSGNKTPQVAIEEVMPQAQAILEDAFSAAK